MRILFVGRGVISTLYGWAFAKAGHEVAFLVRREPRTSLAARWSSISWTPEPRAAARPW
jgi:ketopantoate reductase